MTEIHISLSSVFVLILAETLWNKLFALDERVVDIYMGLYEAYGANAAFYTSNVLEICRLPHNEVVSVFLFLASLPRCSERGARE